MSRIYLPPGTLRRSAFAKRNTHGAIAPDREGAVLGPRLTARVGQDGTVRPRPGRLAPIGGLNPFVRNASAAVVGPNRSAPPSPRWGIKPFSQPMPRVDVMARNPVSCLTPTPTAQANTTQHACNADARGRHGSDRGTAAAGAGLGAPEVRRAPATRCRDLGDAGLRDDELPGAARRSSRGLNSGIDPARTGRPVRFHDKWPMQNPNGVLDVRRHDPAEARRWRATASRSCFRHHNGLPCRRRGRTTASARHTICTHEHNGHHGAENDGLHRGVLLPGPVLRLSLADWRSRGISTDERRRNRSQWRARPPTRAAS